MLCVNTTINVVQILWHVLLLLSFNKNANFVPYFDMFLDGWTIYFQCDNRLYQTQTCLKTIRASAWIRTCLNSRRGKTIIENNSRWGETVIENNSRRGPYSREYGKCFRQQYLVDLPLLIIREVSSNNPLWCWLYRLSYFITVLYFVFNFRHLLYSTSDFTRRYQD